jgi:hypothetical protein
MYFNKIKKILQSFSVTQLAFIPIFLGFLLIIFHTIFKSVYSNPALDILALNVALLVFGCSGIPLIIYKELPSPWHTKGATAVINGALIVLGTWFIPILTALAFIKNFFK